MALCKSLFHDINKTDQEASNSLNNDFVTEDGSKTTRSHHSLFKNCSILSLTVLSLESYSYILIVFKQTRHYNTTDSLTPSIDSEDDFHSGCLNISEQRQFFSGLSSSGQLHHSGALAAQRAAKRSPISISYMGNKR